MNESHRSSWLLGPERVGGGNPRWKKNSLDIILGDDGLASYYGVVQVVLYYSQHQSHTDPTKHQHFFPPCLYICPFLSLFFYFQSTSLKLDIVFLFPIPNWYPTSDRRWGEEEALTNFFNFSSKVSGYFDYSEFILFGLSCWSLHLYNWMMWNFEIIFDLASFVYHPFGWAFYFILWFLTFRYYSLKCQIGAK